MYLVWHLLTTIVCAYECAVCLPQMRGRFIRLIMFFGLGVIHGVVPLFTPIGFFFPGATMDDINMAAFASFAGVVMFAIGFRVYEHWQPSPNGMSESLIDWLAQPHIQAALRRLFWASMILGTAALVGDWYVRAGSITAIFRGGRFDYRFEGGYAATLLRHAQGLLIFPGFIGFFLTRWHRWVGVMFALAVALVLVFATKGARGAAVGLIGGPIMAYILCYPISPRRLINLATAGFVMGVLVVGMYEARKTMSQNTVAGTLLQLVSVETYEKALTRDPLNTHQFLVATVQHFPDEHPYLHGATYRRMPLFLLPSRWFPGVKPEDAHVTFARVVTGRSTTLTTMMPTMMGDGWINFWGLPGVVFIMLVNGVVVAFLYQKVLVSPFWFTVFAYRMVGAAVLAVRGQPYDLFFSLCMSVIVMWILAKMCGISWRSNRAEPSRALDESHEGWLLPSKSA